MHSKTPKTDLDRIREQRRELQRSVREVLALVDRKRQKVGKVWPHAIDWQRHQRERVAI